MSDNSAGQIGLDLVLNKNQFNKQMQGIQNMAKKAGAALASAFAVKKVVDFGEKCIELGSDLQEVQNVVDVTFPKLSKQIDAFARNAAASFGLSETMAKRFTGTFGAMAKAFGFSESAAYEMSTTLTGLAGDVASFYNLSQDEAYTKLKAVFTGETESLKDLGIVMTQTALDSYALANGFGKTTANMSEAEKVALRYKFVQEQLSGATGDFLRTSDGWANQVRVLKLQFDSLKASIGQGLINILTPVLKLINTLIAKLLILGDAFKAFSELITGKKGESTQAGIVAEDAEEASGELIGVAAAASKVKKATAGTGIDELNIIRPASDSGTESSGTDLDSKFNFGSMAEGETILDSTNSKLQGLIDKGKELAGIFSAGFWEGFGDIGSLNTVWQSLNRIRVSVSEIFSGETVSGSVDGFTQKVLGSFGSILGSTLSIGASIADNLFGGIERYLGQNGERLRSRVANLFDLSERSAELAASFAATAEEIFGALRSGPAKQITADIIGMFSEGFWGVTTLAGQFALDTAELLIAPFANNKERIRMELEELFASVQPITTSIRELIGEVFTSANQIYEESVAPIFVSFKQGFSEIVSALLEGWNTHILPVIQAFGQRFREFKDQYLDPLIEKFVEFAGKVSEAITAVWENFLQPFVLWFIEFLYPIISDALAGLGEVFFGLWETISEVVGFVLGALGGLADFITGIFTGDWKKAWSGIKDFFLNSWNLIRTILKEVSGWMVSYLKEKLKSLGLDWEKTWTSTKDFVKNIWENGIKKAITTALTGIRTGINTALAAIRTRFTSIFTGIRDTVTSIFGGLWNGGIKPVINNILSGIEGMANGVVRGVNRVIGALNSLSFEIPDWIPGFGGETFGFSIPTLGEISIQRLAQGGFVPANTPRLVMIGDNTRYGEIVSPEDKLQEMAYQAAMLASQNNLTGQYLQIMIDLLRQIINLIENFDRVVNIDTRELHRKLKELENRSGYGFT